MNYTTLSTSFYDPILARMLNADPFVANPTSAQDYNRYSYVRNNPLKYTDPSGYLVSGGFGGSAGFFAIGEHFLGTGSVGCGVFVVQYNPV